MEQQRVPATRADTVAADARPGRGRLFKIAVVVVLVGLAALVWYRTRPASGGAARYGAGSGAGAAMGPGAGGSRGAPPSTVGVAKASIADLPTYVDALGTVTPPATVTVIPQVTGVLTQIRFKEGQLVARKQLLATIDPRPFDYALKQAQGVLEKDEAQLQAARITLDRYQVLLKQDSIARQTVDTQDATVKQLEGQVVTDRAAIDTARLNLEWSRIESPVAGRVGLRPVDPGNYVGPGTTTGIAVITQLDPIDVEFGVPQDIIPQLQAQLATGGKLVATAYDRTRTQVLGTGAFLALNNLSDTQTGTVRAKARFANAANTLFPSQFVNVRLLLDTVHGATVVPLTAVRHGPDGDFVYLLQPDRTVTMRKVATGVSTTDMVQITSGLRVGDPVITAGGDRLKDGAHVLLPADLAASGSGAGHGHRHGAASGASYAASGGHGHHHHARDADS